MLVFTIIPVVNITIRRLHDVNQSGWLALLMLVPVIGPLVLLNWTVKAGDPEEIVWNRSILSPSMKT